METLSISPLTPSNLRHRGKLFSRVSMTSKGLNHDCIATGELAEAMLLTTGLDRGLGGRLHLPPHPTLVLPTFRSQNLQEGSSILHQEERVPQRQHWYLCPKPHKNLIQISGLEGNQSSHGHQGMKPCLPHLWERAALNSKHRLLSLHLL